MTGPRRRPRRATLAALTFSASLVLACGSDDDGDPRDVASDASGDTLATDTGSGDPDIGDAPNGEPRFSDSCPAERHPRGPCLPIAPSLGDIACPDGWASSVLPPADTAPEHCVPRALPRGCDNGQMPLLGEADCVAMSLGDSDTGASACEVPDDEDIRRRAAGFEGTIRFVDAAAGAPGAGTREAPFSTLEEAVEASADGDIVFLAAGEYAGPFTLAQPIALIGACAGNAVLRSDAPSATSGVVNAPMGGMLRDLRIVGEAIGVWADGGELDVRGVDIDGVRRVGLRAAGSDTVVRAERVWVHGVRGTATDDSFGRGVQANDGALLELRDASVTDVREVGVLAIGAGSRIVATRLAVSGVLEEARQGTPSTGIEAFDGGEVDLTLALVEDVQAIGLAAAAGQVRAQQVIVRRIPGLGEEPARGAVRLGTNATFDARDLWLLEVAGPALGVDGRNASVVVRGLVIDGANAGVVAGEGALVQLRDVSARVHDSGIDAANGAVVEVEDGHFVCLGDEPCVSATFAAELPAARLRISGGAPSLQLNNSASAEVDDLEVLGAVEVNSGSIAGLRVRVASVSTTALSVSRRSELGLVDAVIEAPDGAPHALDQADGQLRLARTLLSGGADATVTVGDGTLVLEDVVVDASASTAAFTAPDGAVTRLRVRVEE